MCSAQVGTLQTAVASSMVRSFLRRETGRKSEWGVCDLATKKIST